MPVIEIVKFPDQVLVTKAEKVKELDAEVKTLIKNLKDTLRSSKHPEGVGLAANQVGVLKRVCLVRRITKNGYEEFVMINPKIISASKETNLDWEGCLSIPNQYGRVNRANKVKVRFEDEQGNEIQINANDFFARVILHEIDHLDGVLFTTKVVGKILTEAEVDKIFEQEAEGAIV
jgi:peptide deformylase